MRIDTLTSAAPRPLDFRRGGYVSSRDILDENREINASVRTCAAACCAEARCSWRSGQCEFDGIAEGMSHPCWCRFIALHHHRLDHVPDNRLRATSTTARKSVTRMSKATSLCNCEAKHDRSHRTQYDCSTTVMFSFRSLTSEAITTTRVTTNASPPSPGSWANASGRTD